MTRRRRPKSKSAEHKKITAPSSNPKIALIGFRGVGKSAIARRLSELWNLPLVALDEQIERKAGARIEGIIKNFGWQHFRDLEYQELQRAAELEKLLLDCGGGIVEEADGKRSERKIAILKEKFFCIYITLNEEKLVQRLKSLARSASRPALPGANSAESLLEIFHRREPIYLEIAHAVVDVSDTNVAESALRITQLFK